MKHICRNCHFLAKEHREENTGRVLTFSASTSEREKAASDNIDFIADYYSLKCYLGVWDEGVNPGKDLRLKQVNEENRKNRCFFYPHDPSMMFEAAKELQKREQENRQLKRSNMYTRIGLWVASLALLVNAIIGILTLTK